MLPSTQPPQAHDARLQQRRAQMKEERAIRASSDRINPIWRPVGKSFFLRERPGIGIVAPTLEQERPSATPA